MFLHLENFNIDWLQCTNYNVLTKLKVCRTLKETTMIILESSLIDNWILKILVFLFVACISMTLFITIKKLKFFADIRSKMENVWYSLLNLIYAARLTKELEKRNEVIRMEQLKTYLIEQYEIETPIDLSSETESEKSLDSEKSEPLVEVLDSIKEPNLIEEEKELPTQEETSPRKEKLPTDLISLPIQSKPSTDSNLSPPVKKQKLESGEKLTKTSEDPIASPRILRKTTFDNSFEPTSRMIRKLTSENSESSNSSLLIKPRILRKPILKTITDTEYPSRMIRKPSSNFNFTKTEIPRLNLKNLHIRQSSSNQIRAPPPSPSSTMTTPRNRKGSDVNVSSIKSGIFEGRKRLIEKPKSDGSGSDRSSNSKKSVAIVDGKGNIKYVHKSKIGSLNK